MSATEIRMEQDIQRVCRAQSDSMLSATSQLAADMGKSECLAMSPMSQTAFDGSQMISTDAGHEVSFHPKALHLNDVLTPKEIDDFVNNMSDEEVQACLQ